jgi:type III secretory pathway component EscV
MAGGIFVGVKMTALQMSKNIGNESGVQSGDGKALVSQNPSFGISVAFRCRLPL